VLGPSGRLAARYPRCRVVLYEIKAPASPALGLRAALRAVLDPADAVVSANHLHVRREVPMLSTVGMDGVLGTQSSAPGQPLQLAVGSVSRNDKPDLAEVGQQEVTRLGVLIATIDDAVSEVLVTQPADHLGGDALAPECWVYVDPDQRDRLLARPYAEHDVASLDVGADLADLLASQIDRFWGGNVDVVIRHAFFQHGHRAVAVEVGLIVQITTCVHVCEPVPHRRRPDAGKDWVAGAQRGQPTLPCVVGHRRIVACQRNRGQAVFRRQAISVARSIAAERSLRRPHLRNGGAADQVRGFA
jgi:hypothetical protein